MKKDKKKDKFLEEDLELEEMKKTSDLVFKVENINLHYGEKQALKNLNFVIKKNEVTAFIGPSGVVRVQ